MIGIALVLGAAAIVGVGLIVIFWNEIINFLKRAYEKLKTRVIGVIKGTSVALRKTVDGFERIVRMYSQDNETKKWQETIVRKHLTEDEIPQEFRDRIVDEDEFDITDELEMQIANA